jgi:hypothetical protein
MNIDINLFDKYVESPSQEERLRILSKWKTSEYRIEFEALKALLNGPIPHKEKVALAELSGPLCSLQDEEWVFDQLIRWPQELAATMIRTWSTNSKCMHWKKLLQIASIPTLPQRISYTILDVTSLPYGYDVTSLILSLHGWEDYSSAYHAILFDKSIEFACQSTRLTTLAQSILHRARQNAHSDDKSLHSAMTWLIYSGHHNILQDLLLDDIYSAWKQFAMTAVEAHLTRKKTYEKISRLLDKSGTTAEKIAELIPPPWSKIDFPSDLLTKINLPSIKLSHVQLRRITAGIPRTILTEEFLMKDLHSKETYPENFSNDVSGSRPKAHGFISWITSSTQTNYDKSKDQEYWTMLTESKQSPDIKSLSPLSIVARKHHGLGILAYIETLGRFQGSDEAVLKLMDFIRSNNEDELLAVTAALANISTPRSLMELISMITRPNASLAVQQLAVYLLSKKDFSSLQKEIRATIKDLQVPEDSSSPIIELRDALAGLLKANSADDDSDSRINHVSIATLEIDDRILDRELSGIIGHYQELSSEVRRALRTALFFNKTTAASTKNLAIDLSPLIDMQYKAMELLYREIFEEAVSRILNKGDIPRKLDVIGYARPIPQKMDEFENYIAALPIVRDIPFFSKFKLRKMLRAICQFQPGRRFTLDGLKAFGLFFLCFGRLDCRYGLANTFTLGMKSDIELAKFTRELHLFQDFRNRAAHEGFHPEASNDIQGIWRSTATCVQVAFQVKSNLESKDYSNHKKAS